MAAKGTCGLGKKGLKVTETPSKHDDDDSLRATLDWYDPDVLT